MARRISLLDISSKRRRLRRLLLWSGILLAIILLIAGSLWAAARSSLFKIRNVEVVGATYLPPAQIEEFIRSRAAEGRIKKFFGSDNLLVWPRGFSENELRDLPAVSALRIEKHLWRRSVTVTVSERKRVGIWCFANADPKRCFWFSPDGLLFMPAYYAQGNLIPVLDDYSREPLNLGDRVLEPRLLPNIASIFGALSAAHVSVREIRLNNLDRQEVEAYTYEGPKLLFSLRFPAAGVADAAKAVAKITPLSQLQYIDFRVENKVYYK